MIDIDLAILALAAVLGALFSAALGWLESAEPFEPKKFTSSILRAIVAGVLFAVGGTYVPGVETTLLMLFLAFLGGAGVDVYGHRLAGVVAASLSKT